MLSAVRTKCCSPVNNSPPGKREVRRMKLPSRETPLSSIALENCLKLSREGVIIMPVSPPWYRNPKDLDQSVAGFTDKILALLGEPAGSGWRDEELE